MNNIVLVDPTAVVHPTAVIGNPARFLEDAVEGTTLVTIIGPHTNVGERAAVSAGSRIGAFCTLARGAIVGFGVDVGNFVTIASDAGVNHCATIGHHTVLEQNSWVSSDSVVAPYCVIGRYAHVGAAAQLGTGVWIGDNLTVWAGAVIPDHWRLTSEVPQHSPLGLQISTGVHPEGPNQSVRLCNVVGPADTDPEYSAHTYVEGESWTAEAHGGRGITLYPLRMLGQWCGRGKAIRVVTMRVPRASIEPMRRSASFRVYRYDDARLFYVRM